MIIETRRIMFSISALREAVLLYRSLYPDKLSAGDIGRIWFPSAAPLVMQVSISAATGAFRESNLTESEVAVMLILFCRKLKVPLPRGGEKSIEPQGDGVVLTVSSRIDIDRKRGPAPELGSR